MNKFLILAICLAVFLSGCDSEVLQEYVDRIDTDRSKSIENSKIESPEKPEEPSRLETTIALEAGIYGIPFGATTEEVMKWCTDNNMAIGNPTEKDVKDAARKAVRRVIGLKEAYDFEMSSLPPLEQQLLKLYTDADDIYEQAKVAAAKEKLDILKNPTVSYDGHKYYLLSLRNGVTVEVDGQEKTCTDDRITRTTYRLILTPTDKSRKMIDNGVKAFNVFLYGDIGQELRSYAVLAVFSDGPERSVSAQFEIVYDVMCQKYGFPYIGSGGSSELRDEIEEILGPELGPIYKHEIKALWARNFLLFSFGEILKEHDSKRVVLRSRSGSNEFSIFYYDHESVSRIFELYTKAIDDFEKEYYEKKEIARTQAQKDF